eukprot:3622630-Pleurochrysis_carterae.AAC.1
MASFNALLNRRADSLTAECTTPPVRHTSISSTALPKAPSDPSWNLPVPRSPPALHQLPFGTTP